MGSSTYNKTDNGSGFGVKGDYAKDARNNYETEAMRNQRANGITNRNETTIYENMPHFNDFGVRRPINPYVPPKPLPPRKIPNVTTVVKAKPYSPMGREGGNNGGGSTRNGPSNYGGVSDNNSRGVNAVQNGGVSRGTYSAKRDPYNGGGKMGSVTTSKTTTSYGGGGNNGGGQNSNGGGGSSSRGSGGGYGGLSEGGSERR